MRLALISAQRTGSRWLCEMLSSYLGSRMQDEITSSGFEISLEDIKTNIDRSYIIKLHDVLPSYFEQRTGLDDLHIVGIVRNIRDCAVSYSFHHRYHLWEESPQKFAKTDLDAIKYTVYKDELFDLECKFQLDMMKDVCKRSRYNWVIYKKLRENPHKELAQLIKNNGIEKEIDVRRLKRAVDSNSFTAKTGRVYGIERRNDMWRRKAVVGDWKNWFDNDMIKHTKALYDKFVELSGENYEDV